MRRMRKSNYSSEHEYSQIRQLDRYIPVADLHSKILDKRYYTKHGSILDGEKLLR